MGPAHDTRAPGLGNRVAAAGIMAPFVLHIDSPEKIPGLASPAYAMLAAWVPGYEGLPWHSGVNEDGVVCQPFWRLS